jgi:hypothetical protein
MRFLPAVVDPYGYNMGGYGYQGYGYNTGNDQQVVAHFIKLLQL